MTTDPLLALYRALSAEQLLQLRADFETERSVEGADAATRAFCTERLAIIETVERDYDTVDRIRAARR